VPSEISAIEQFDLPGISAENRDARKQTPTKLRLRATAKALISAVVFVNFDAGL
jgi:hypothetical protein